MPEGENLLPIYYDLVNSEYEIIDEGNDLFAKIRRKYFEDKLNSKSKETFSVGEQKIVCKYSIAPNTPMKWRKKIDSFNAEYTVPTPDKGYVIIHYSKQKYISKKSFYDRQHMWIKTEFYSCHSQNTAKIIVMPSREGDNLLVQNLIPNTDKYEIGEYVACQIPRNQKLNRMVNFAVGEPSIMVQNSNGLFYYCLPEVAKARLEYLRTIALGDQPKTTEKVDAEGISAEKLSFETAENVGTSETACSPEAATRAVSIPKLEFSAQVEDEPQADKVQAIPDTQCEMSNQSNKPAIFVGLSDEYKTLFKKVNLKNNKPIAVYKPKKENSKNENLKKEEKIKNQIENQNEKQIGIKINLSKNQDEKEIKNPSHELEIVPFGENGEYTVLRSGQAVAGVARPVFNSNSAMRYYGKIENEKPNGLGIKINPIDYTMIISEFNDGVPQNFVSAIDEKGKTIYSGEWIDNQKTGFGFGKSDKNTYYTGFWKDGQRDGIGSEFYSDGVLSYSGHWKNDNRDGYGISYENGEARYCGLWEKNEYSGRGRLILRDGSYIEGNFKESYLQENSIQYSESGKKMYEGEWKNYLYHGKGKRYLENGGYYQGEFADGIAHGMLNGYDAQGDLIYRGEWKENLYDGSGTLYSKDGKKIYEGSFEKGKFQGKGNLFDSNEQQIYSGEFSAGKRDGIGTSYYKLNIEYIGQWNDDCKDGYGVEYESGKPRFVGRFMRDKKQGRINMVSSDKVVCEAIYNDNQASYIRAYKEDKPFYEGAVKENQPNGMGCTMNEYGEKIIEGFFSGRTLMKAMTVGLKSIEKLPYIEELRNTDYEKYRKGNNFILDKKYNGGVYSGYWENDKPHGKGSILYEDHRYTGSFANGIAWGTGIIYPLNGEKIEGKFLPRITSEAQCISFADNVSYIYVRKAIDLFEDGCTSKEKISVTIPNIE